MNVTGTDRTAELELRLREFHVNSEDTCSFWAKDPKTVISLRRCHYCVHYEPDEEHDQRRGVCRLRQDTAH